MYNVCRRQMLKIKTRPWGLLPLLAFGKEKAKLLDSELHRP